MTLGDCVLCDSTAALIGRGADVSVMFVFGIILILPLKKGPPIHLKDSFEGGTALS